jgi:hypothetical protein
MKTLKQKQLAGERACPTSANVGQALSPANSCLFNGA